ncbi:MAG: L,D-transpeptidase family protein [Paludibacter sp.]|nr:L,D-transpeptidase family protein [Paludibacter sp.]
MKYLKLIIFIIIASIFITCNVKSTKQQNDENSIIIIKEKFDSQRLDSAIKQKLHYISQVLPDSCLQSIYSIYSANKFHSFWVDSLTNNIKVDTLLFYLSEIDKHGISLQQLGIDTLLNKPSSFDADDIDYSSIANFDIQLSIVYLKYCSGLQYGFVNELDTMENHNVKLLRSDSLFRVNCFSKVNDSLSYFLKEIQPKSDVYLSLIKEKNKIKLLVDSVFDSIPLLMDKEIIKFGAKHPIIPLIARRLMMSGELVFDSAYINHYVMFDDKLLNGLNIFREKTGLLLDKEIGYQTITTLNTPFSYYVDKINANLERMRWKYVNPKTGKHIHVNVADMTLEAFHGDSIDLRMKVCVGKPPRNKTPLLESKIYEIILNPTWTVPNSIILKEISKIAVVDTNYFKRLNMKIFRKGDEVQPKTVKWDLLSKTYQPYIIIQDSGSINALGRIKFNFSNRFSVYLHDTNSKSAFRRHNRAVSHGCVRVEKPLELAYFCLPKVIEPSNKKLVEKDNLLKDKIRYTIGLKPKSKIGKDSLRLNNKGMKMEKLRLKPYIPIFLEYRTCFLNPEGKVQFRNDIYQFDHELIRLLKDLK